MTCISSDWIPVILAVLVIVNSIVQAVIAREVVLLRIREIKAK